MKKLTVLIAALFALAAPVAAFSAMDHGAHKQGSAAHEEVVDGVKATFSVIGMKEHLKAMKIEMPKGMKETHHVMVVFKDVKSGKALTEGEVKVKLQGPDKSVQAKGLTGMDGHFGADFNLSNKGKYGVMSKFQLKDGKVRSARFWYTVK